MPTLNAARNTMQSSEIGGTDGGDHGDKSANIRLTRTRMLIAYYQRGLAVHIKPVVLRIRTKTQLAQRNGTRTRKGKSIKRNNHSIM